MTDKIERERRANKELFEGKYVDIWML